MVRSGLKKEDIMRLVKDDYKASKIIETSRDVIQYYDIMAAMGMGFQFSYKDISFERIGIMTNIHYELNKQKAGK